MAITIFNKLHKLTYVMEEGKNKVEIAGTISSSLISKSKVKAALKFKSKDFSHQLSANVDVGSEKHSFLLSTTFTDEEKRAVVELNTPLFNIRKFVTNAALSFNGKRTVASLKFETPDKVHSFDGSLVGIKHGVFKIDTPWVAREVVRMEFDVKKADAKFVFAKGDEEFKCEMEYKMIAALNMEGKIHIKTPLKAMKFMKIEGSLKQKDGELKVKFNIDSDLPKFSHVNVDGHFKKSDAAIEFLFDASTPLEHLEEIRFKLLAPLSMDNLKSHIKFETTSNKFEILGAVNDHSKNLEASLKFFWNNKEVVLTCDFLNEKNMDLKLKLKTPFAGFEKFMIEAKAHKFDLKKMSLVAEFNDKRWEVMGSIAMKEEKMVDFKLKTPLAGHEKYQFTLKVDAGNMVATVLLPAKKTSLIVNYEIKGVADVLLYAELEGVLEHPAVFELIHKINKAEHKYYGSAELLFKAKKIVSVKTGGSFEGKALAIQLDAAALEHTFYVTVDGSVKDVAVTCKSSLFKKRLHLPGRVGCYEGQEGVFPEPLHPDSSETAWSLHPQGRHH